VLGGSSAINGLLYVRGQAQDFDVWRQLGNAGWAYADVLPYFKRSEDQERGADDYHGAGGPLGVSDVRLKKNELCEAFIAACEAAGIPVAPIWDMAQAAASDHVRARGLLRSLRHPLFGKVEFTTQPVRFSGTSPAAPRAEPRLGEDSASVLTGWLHLTAAEIAALEGAGVIRGFPSGSGAG